MFYKCGLLVVVASIAFFFWNKQAALFSLIETIVPATAAVLTWLVFAVLLFLFLHFIKLIRYYLILSEIQLPLGQYVRLYLQVTLVNIIIPFKLGEIFRFAMVAGQCKSAPLSVLSIISERFFDTCIIVVMLMIHVVFLGGELAAPLLFLALFVVICFLAYCTYPSTSRYLNRFIVLKPPIRSDVYYLQALDYMDGWYNHEQRIVKDKGWLLLICSMFAWLIEYLFFAALAKIFNLPFGMDIFSKYISSILTVSSDFPSAFNTSYGVICIFVFAILYFWVVCRRNIKEALHK